MSAIEFDDYFTRYPVLDIEVGDIQATVEALEPFTQAGAGESQEFCLVACAVRSLIGADYVEIDYFGPANDTRGVAVTKHGDDPIKKWTLRPEIALLAADFDRAFGGYDATREEALEWLKTR